MLPFKRTFESEKHQLKELNSRLAQYLSRTKQLEQENAHLITEIHRLRQAKTAEWEPRYKAELRELRGAVLQMSMEKSQAERDREKLWQELQMLQSLCSEQTEVCRDVSGELDGCKTELHNTHRANGELQQRLYQLENEYKRLEDAQRQEIGHFRRQVESRVVPIIMQTYRGPPAASVEEVQEYARGLSEGWIETFEMYQQKVEEMEQAIRADQARLSDLQREKMLYASEMGKLRTEAEKQGQMQMHLEEQLMAMQDRFRADLSEHQMIIEQLEHERNMMAEAMAEKMQDHQQLLKVKMDLGMEVSAYRALLEGGRVGLPDAHRRGNQHQRERIIDIKTPAQPCTLRASTSVRQPMNTRYMPTTSNLRRSPVPDSGFVSPPRVIPISVTARAQHQSPESRRDMISFTKARAAAAASAAASASAPTPTKEKQMVQNDKEMGPNVQKPTTEAKNVKIKPISQVETESGPVKSSTAETRSVRVVSPPMMRLSEKSEMERKKKVTGEKEIQDECDVEFNDKGESTIGPSQKKVLDSVSVDEIIEKVIKPAGLEAKACSSGESKIVYHLEKIEQDDGTIKTQIVLQSKVEEDVDIAEDSALDELLSQEVKKVSLEDIKNTPTGSMIQNLLSGLQGGEGLQNKSVNVEIIEEPVDCLSDEEHEVEQKSRSSFNEPSSTYFQIEELENAPQVIRIQRSDDDAIKTFTAETTHSKGGFVQVHEIPRESESPYFSHDQESHEYFVSTPDDNLSEPEEVSSITSYGHYGVVDDLSDERYYQDENLPPKRVIVEENDEYKFMSSPFVKDSFPECIIEEEIRVSPIVQESVLEYLREDKLEPKDQLRGALEKLQGSVSGHLREELAYLTKVSGESGQNVAVKKVQQSSDNGTMTIVAELNVSQTLEESGLLEDENEISEEQIMAALRSSNIDKAFPGGAGGGYSFRVSTEEDVVHRKEFEGFTNDGQSAFEISEKRITVGPSEQQSFTFQMQGSHDEATSERELPSEMSGSPGKICHEKRVATVYLESPTDD